MRAYTIRFKNKDGQSVFAEIVAATEIDAREEIERKNPNCEIISSFEKPGRY